MPTVYIETSIPSYLAAAPSRDPLTAARQMMTHAWWPTAVEVFECYTSDSVIEEVLRGDAQAAERRMEYLEGLDILALSPQVESLIRVYRDELGLQGSALADLPHFAYAVAYNMDYLVTWNCRHIANGHVIRRLQRVNRKIGWETPIVLTPEELPPTD